MTPVDQATRDAIRDERAQCAFVAAGAGTGKSTTLVSRIVATVTDEQSDVRIRDIAAITFTDRAGGELREKVREALVRAAANGSERAQQALRDVDAAVVGTIHSFALTILREHALAADLPLGFEVADDGGAASSARQRWRDIVEVWQTELPVVDRSRLDTAGISLLSLRTLVDGLQQSRLRLDNSLVDPPQLVDTARLRDELVEGLGGFVADALAECQDPSDKLALHLSEAVRGLVEALRDASEDDLVQMRVDWDDAWAACFKPGNVGAAKAWGSRERAREVRDELKAWKARVDECLAAPLDNAVRTAAAIAWRELRRAERQRVLDGVIDFDDQLLIVRDLLESRPDVRAAVSRRFRIVLVDEFQDTDPVQWRIIRLVTSDPDDSDAVPKPGRLVVVGDPKQSIYAFRGADIRTYLAAGRDFPGGTYDLVTSFRSVTPVVDWVNNVFRRLILASDVQPPYTDLAPLHRPEASTPPGPPVVVLRDPPDPVDAGDDEPAGASSSVQTMPSTQLEPLLVATVVRRGVAEGWQVTEPVDGGSSRRYAGACAYRDIAILVPTRTGVPAMLDALDAAGVPYRSADASIVLDRPLVSGLVSALRVVNDPDDQLSLWWTLTSPVFGCGDDDLLRYRRDGGSWVMPRRDATLPDGPVSAALRTLARLRDTWVAPQPADVLDALVSEQCVEQMSALVPRGRFDADCVRMVASHARSWQDDGGVGLSDYLTSLDTLKQGGSRATLSEPDDRDDDAVRISTVHSAKGLEFPVVVLAGMATGKMSQVDPVGVRFDGGFEFSVAGLKSGGYERWKTEQYTPRDEAELLRLLYVACTRARDHLVVSVVGANRRGGTPPRSEVIREAVLDAAAETVDAPDEFPPMSDDVAPQPMAPLPEDWQERVAAAAERSAQPWVRSPSSHAGTEPRPEVEPERDAAYQQPVADDDSAPALARRARDGRPVGRALHAALDALFSRPSPPDTAAVDEACRRAVDVEGIPDAYDDVHRRVSAALGTDLAAETFASARRWTELYLAAPVERGLCSPSGGLRRPGIRDGGGACRRGPQERRRAERTGDRPLPAAARRLRGTAGTCHLAKGGAAGSSASAL